MKQQLTHCVYHIHAGTGTDDGYIGVTKRLRNRLYAHRAKGILQESSCIDILLVGSEKECLDLERTLRPLPNMGWNTAEGGWNFLNASSSIGLNTRFTKGHSKGKSTQFKAGGVPHNAGATRFALTSPSGELFIVDNLTAFCKEHELTPSNIRKVARGLRKHAKGWVASVVA